MTVSTRSSTFLQGYTSALILFAFSLFAAINAKHYSGDDHYTTPLAFISAFAALIASLKVAERRLHDPREPPIRTSSIPYLGHIIGILTRGSVYFKQLGREHSGPIVTLPMPGSRLYIVTDPSLAASVQRASKVLSFSPLVPPIIQRVAGFDNATIAMMKSDMETGYIQQVQNAVHARLSQGPYLEQVTLNACNEFSRRLDLFTDIELRSGSTRDIELLSWVKNLVTVATATFFYGPNNPVERDLRLVDQFWDFDAGIPGLLLGVLPQWTARKAYLGREAVVQALKEYQTSSAYNEAAAITRERSQIGKQLGVSIDGITRSDLTFFFAGIINTSLTSFWMIANIFKRQTLLATIRAELEAITVPSTDDSNHMSISIQAITKQCPHLYAVFKEVLRLYSENFATRVVLADTLLADKFLLKKDSILQISGGVIHADERIWGADVAEFKPERHLAYNKTKFQGISSEKMAGRSDGPLKQVHPAAFRAFGGGATLCPGRHFALNEILVLVTMIVLQFDVVSRSGEELEVPVKNDAVLPIHVLEPVKSMPVAIRRRKTWIGRRLGLLK